MPVAGYDWGRAYRYKLRGQVDQSDYGYNSYRHVVVNRPLSQCQE